MTVADARIAVIPHSEAVPSSLHFTAFDSPLLPGSPQPFTFTAKCPRMDPGSSRGGHKLGQMTIGHTFCPYGAVNLGVEWLASLTIINRSVFVFMSILLTCRQAPPCIARMENSHRKLKNNSCYCTCFTSILLCVPRVFSPLFGEW